MRQLYIIVLILMAAFELNAQDACDFVDYELSIEGNATACAGSATGSATVSSTGCQCMFSGCKYYWSDGQTFHTATGLTAGEYEVIVAHPVYLNESDSLPFDSCFMSITVVIEEGEPLLLSSDQTNVSCRGGNDGSITLDPSPLAGTLNFAWTNGATTSSISGLQAGTYGVQIYNFENCAEELIFTIEEPQNELTIEEVLTTPTCEGLETGSVEFIIANANGETTILIYDDDDNLVGTNNLGEGIYEAFITDENGCTIDTEFLIEVGDLSFELMADTETICLGDATEISVIVDANATVNWFPTNGISDPSSLTVLANPQQTTTYNVEVITESGCSATKQIEIVVEETPEINLTYNANLTICEGEFINVFANVSGAQSYQWEPVDGVSNPETNAVYLSPETSTEYTVTAVLHNGCEAIRSLIIEVEDCSEGTFIEKAEIITEIFPNPSNGVFHIHVSGINKASSYKIFSLAGNIVQKGFFDYDTFIIDLTENSSGVYLLNVQTEGNSYVARLLKR